MQYIDVSQFYQSVLCFSIPLLLIQRLIIYWNILSSKYEDYRIQFYEEQFKFTKEFEYAEQKENQMPQQATNKDSMLDKRQHQISIIKDQIHIDQYIQNSQMERKQTYNFTKQHQFSGMDIHNKDNETKGTQQQVKYNQFKRKSMVNIDLQVDKQLKNNQAQQSLHIQKVKSVQDLDSKPQLAKKERQGKQQISQGQSQYRKKQKVEQVQIKGDKKYQQQIQQSRMSRFSQLDKLEVRRQTLLDDQMQKDVNKNRNSAAQNKQVINLGEGPLLQKAQNQKLRLKYCRRIDDAFNDYMPIIMSVVILGIITQSVYIYSMCCFFGFAFSSLLFNYTNLLQKLEGAQTQTFFGKANQLISSLFIIGLFISYWISDQFY